MDKIYKRYRIRLPSINYFRYDKNAKKKKRIMIFIVVIIVAIATIITTIESISPIIDKICEDTAKAKATIVSNNVATEVMKNYTYEDFVKIYKDESGNITMLQSNIITINEITSDVAVKIQKKLEENDENNTKIKLRKLYRA